MNEPDEHYVEFLKSGEDAPEAFKSSEQAFDLITPPVHDLVIFPGLHAIGLGRYDGNKSQVHRQLSGFVALVCAIHQQMDRPVGFAQAADPLAPLGGIMDVAWREGKGYGRSSIRGNHMNLGGPSPPGFADGLWAVFFNAPVPSG